MPMLYKSITVQGVFLYRTKGLSLSGDGSPIIRKQVFPYKEKGLVRIGVILKIKVFHSSVYVWTKSALGQTAPYVIK